VDSRKISLKLLTGTPGEPAPELIRNESTYELALASVCVRPGAETLTDEDIVDERPDDGLCGYASPVWLNQNVISDKEIDGILML